MITSTANVGWLPSHISLTKHGIAAETPDKAKYVLADVRPIDIFEDRHMYVCYGTTSLMSYVVPFTKLKVNAYYVEVSTRLSSCTKYGRLIFARAQCGFDSAPYNVWDSKEITRYVLKFGGTSRIATKEEIRYAVSLFNGVSTVPFLRTSAGHLRYLTFNELREVRVKNMPSVYRLVAPLLYSLKDKGLHESMAVGIFLWACCLDEPSRAMMEGSLAMRPCNSVKDYMLNAKNMSIRCKAMQNNVDVDLTPFFEMEVLANRGVGDIDWEKEKENRSNPNLSKLPLGKVRELCAQVFQTARAQGKKPRPMDWDRFFKDRWSWAPSGSYHSQHPEDMTGISGARELRNKFYMLSQMTHKPFSHFANRRAETIAYASTKLEWGKQRAIYGVDLTNFIMSSYGMMGCEDVLPNDFPVGDRANDDYIKAKLDVILKGRVPYCLDFEDFNSQHSFPAMQIVLEEYRKTFAEYLSQEQHQAIIWTGDALANTRVLVPKGNSKDEYRAKGTLLSGWRLTTFVNSVLNWVYTHACCDEVLNTTGLHNGDDVLIPVDTYGQVKKIEANLRKYNLRSQPAKCNLAGIAEFLRVDRAQGDGAQYLSRAVSTYVHGRIESMVPNNLLNVLQSLRERATQLVRRRADADTVESLVDISIARVAVLWDKEKQFLTRVYRTHKLAGGTNDDVLDESETGWYKQCPREINTEQIQALKLKSILPGAYDYAENLCERMFTETDIKPIARQATSAIYSALSTARVDIEESSNEYGMSVGWLSTFYKSLKLMKNYGRAALAKAYGFPAMSNSDEEEADAFTTLYQYDDIMLWAKLLI